MKENEKPSLTEFEKLAKGCIKIRNEYICIYPSKDLGKRDIIYYDSEKHKAQSVRSTTELMNILGKKKIPDEEIIKAIHFVGERLRELERERIAREVHTPLLSGKSEEERE